MDPSSARKKRASPSSIDAATQPPPAAVNASAAKRPRRTPTRSFTHQHHHGAAVVEGGVEAASAGAMSALPSTPLKVMPSPRAKGGSSSSLKAKGTGKKGEGSGSDINNKQEEGDSSPTTTIFPRIKPTPAKTILHTLKPRGAAAAQVVALWLDAQLADRGPPQPSSAEIEWLMETQGVLLGAVGGCYRRATGGQNEEVRVGEAAMVTRLCRLLLERRERVAQSAGRAVLGIVQAASHNPYACTPRAIAAGSPNAHSLPPHATRLLGPLPPAPPALAHLLSEPEALGLICRKLGDFRPDWRCWAVEVLLHALPFGAQARLLSPPQRTAAGVGMLADPNRDVRHTAAALLSEKERVGVLFVADAPDTHVKAAVELLDNACLPMRTAAVKILSRFPPTTQAAILAHLLLKLASPVRGTRLFALEALRSGLPLPLPQDPTAQQTCLPLVLRRLGDRAPCVRRAAGAVLEGLPIPVLTEWRVVERLLGRAVGGVGEGQSAPSAVRAGLLEVVARLPPALLQPHAAALCSLLTSTAPADVRRATLQALGRLPSAALAPYIVPRLLHFLNHDTEPHAPVRLAAITALQHRDIEHVAPVLPDLVRALRADPSDACRAACATTLASLDPPDEAVVPFTNAIFGRLITEDEVPSVRLAALKALARLPLHSLRAYVPPTPTTTDEGLLLLLEALVGMGLRHEAAAVRATTVELLRDLPLDAGAGPFCDAVLPLTTQTMEADPSVRCLALEALIGLPAQLLPHRSVGLLAAAARGDSEARVRAVAARVLRSWGLRAPPPPPLPPSLPAALVGKEEGQQQASGKKKPKKKREKENAGGSDGGGASALVL